MLWLTGVSLITQGWISQNPFSRVLSLHSLLTQPRRKLGEVSCLFLQHRDGLMACDTLGIECCLSLGTKFSLQPESFLFFVKGFKQYPKHEKIKGQARKTHRRRERLEGQKERMERRMEKPGKLAVLVTPESAVAWGAFLEVVTYSPWLFPIMLTWTKCIL